MENTDWPLDFPFAPSHCELHHDWGSGGPLSNVDISHVAKANATSVKYRRKQSAKIPFTPPWVNWSPELSHQGTALVTPRVVYNAGHLYMYTWAVNTLGWAGHCPAQGQQGAPGASGPQHLWSCATHKASLEMADLITRIFLLRKHPHPNSAPHLLWSVLLWCDQDHFTLQVPSHPSQQQQQEDPHGITRQGLLAQPNSAQHSNP